MPETSSPRSDASIDPPLRVVSHRFDHCDQISEMTGREANVEFTQLSPGRFAGMTTRFELADLRVHHTWTVGRTLNRAQTQERLLYLHVLVRTRELIWEGSDVAQPVLIQHCGQDEFVRVARDLEMVVVAAPRERLLRDAAALAGATDAPVQLARGVVWNPSAAARSFMEVARAFAEDVEGGRMDPGDLDRLETLRGRLEDSLVQMLVDQIGVRDARPRHNGSRARIVRRAQQHLEEVGGRRATIADLCREIGVSLRTLEYAFRDICGVSPQQYILAKRMRAAQRALREAEPERGAVKRAALDAGFRDLGRFSVAYRRFFGESAAETLNRFVA